MSVSIVIPAYNAESYFAQTIESVIRQNYQQWELVIINDGSKDTTAALAQSYADREFRIRVVHQSNSGVAATRNRGLAEADRNSEYVLFLDQDDLLEPNALTTLMQVLDAEPLTVAVHGHGRYIDERGDVWHPGEAEALSQNRWKIQGNHLVSVAIDEPTTFETLVYLNCIWTPGQVMIRRDALVSVGPFDQETAPCDDWDMWLRLSYYGQIAAVNKITLNIRRHTTNASNNMKAMRRAELAVRRGLLVLTKKDERNRHLVLTGYRQSELYFGRQYLDHATKAIARRDWIIAAKLMRHVAMFYTRSIPGVPI